MRAEVRCGVGALLPDRALPYHALGILVCASAVGTAYVPIRLHLLASPFVTFFPKQQRTTPPHAAPNRVSQSVQCPDQEPAWFAPLVCTGNGRVALHLRGFGPQRLRQLGLRHVLRVQALKIPTVFLGAF